MRCLRATVTPALPMRWAAMSEAAPDAGPLVVAVGDVHGKDAMLARLHAKIAEATRAQADRRRVLVHVGDYVDRGSDSAGVIRRVRTGLDGFETINLRGNHEQMMLDAVMTRAPDRVEHWLLNGGREALASFGCAGHPMAAIDDLAQRAADVIDWLAALPYMHREGRYLFVHAGIVPGRALPEQKMKDLLWIRDQFLDSDADHGAIVVHGHTPTDDGAPELRANRIGIDTGAAKDGPLTAVILDGAAPPQVLQVYPHEV